MFSLASSESSTILSSVGGDFRGFNSGPLFVAGHDNPRRQKPSDHDLRQLLRLTGFKAGFVLLLLSRPSLGPSTGLRCCLRHVCRLQVGHDEIVYLHVRIFGYTAPRRISGHAYTESQRRTHTQRPFFCGTVVPGYAAKSL